MAMPRSFKQFPNVRCGKRFADFNLINHQLIHGAVTGKY